MKDSYSGLSAFSVLYEGVFEHIDGRLVVHPDQTLSVHCQQLVVHSQSAILQYLTMLHIIILEQRVKNNHLHLLKNGLN